jgi:ATP-dependent helicase HrpA
LATALIKTLPKALRRHVVPAADFADKALAGMPDEPSVVAGDTTDFLDALAAELTKASYTRIVAGDFDIERVPDHLRVTFRVIDSRGTRLGAGPVLSFLQEKFASQSRDAVAGVLVAEIPAPGPGLAQATDNKLERGLASWDFDELPRTIDTSIGANTVRGFPAVVPASLLGVGNTGNGATGDSMGKSSGAVASVRILATAEQQLAVHPLGVRALIRATIASPAKYVLEHLTQNERLALAAAPYKNSTDLVDDSIDAAIDRVLFAMRPDGRIFSKHEFETLRDRVQSQLMDSLFDTTALVVRILTAVREADKAIANTNALAFMAVLTAEKQHLADLVCPRFISRAGLDRLPRILVFVRAITERVTRMADDPGRDRTVANELDAALALFESAGGRIPLPELTSALDYAALAAASSASPITRARWALEELRVSLFAQHLGTAEPVSLQRIKKMLA